MSIQKISGINSVAFKGETPKETDTKADKKPDEIKDGTKKLALALGGLAAVGAVALFAAKNKKIPSELKINKFKKIGQFENGKAIVKGKPYTGIIKVSNKNGDFSIKYTDGILQSSRQIVAKGEGADAAVSAFEKVYSYNDDGKLSEVAKYKYYTADGKTSFTLADLTDEGTLKNNIVKFQEGSLKIGDRKIVSKQLSAEHDKILIRETSFKEDGSFDGIMTGYKPFDKSKVEEAIQNAIKKTESLDA